MMTGSLIKAGINQGRLPEGYHSRQSLEGTKGQRQGVKGLGGEHVNLNGPRDGET